VSSLDDIVGRLEQIDEELAELAIDRLKVSVVDNDADAAAEERRITRARRQVEKAAGILAGMPADD
jgi:hypothetical protein